MRRWVRFFFGSPQRATTTMLALAILGAIHYFAPGTINRLVVGVINELGPLFAYGLVLLIICIGIRVIVRGLR